MGPKRQVARKRGVVRRAKLKHHYGEDDRKYAVGDRFQSRRAQFVLGQ
jgi:hypothetical protein